MAAMGYRVRQFQETPNPNALKCIVDGRITEQPRSFFNAEEAGGDAIGAALFAVPGVTNVLISGDWVTVCKRPEARWDGIKAGVQQVLEAVE
jgi:hypothetical protein